MGYGLLHMLHVRGILCRAVNEIKLTIGLAKMVLREEFCARIWHIWCTLLCSHFVMSDCQDVGSWIQNVFHTDYFQLSPKKLKTSLSSTVWIWIGQPLLHVNRFHTDKTGQAHLLNVFLLNEKLFLRETLKSLPDTSHISKL